MNRKVVPVAPRKRGGTTALGIVLVVLGALGLAVVCAGVGVVAAISQTEVGKASQNLEFTPLMLVDTVLNTITKLGLITMGTLVLRRNKKALPVTIATFALSLLTLCTAAYQAFVVAPEGLEGPGKPLAIATFSCTATISIGIYVFTWVYLRKPQTLVELDPDAATAEVFS